LLISGAATIAGRVNDLDAGGMPEEDYAPVEEKGSAGTFEACWKT
jgi:hypothetical protein